jgi:ribosome maturation factor RimP
MRACIAPLFIKVWHLKKSKFIVDWSSAEKPSLFLIDLAITDAFKVIITLDDDNGVVLQDCIDESRIDLSLDREEQDYSLKYFLSRFLHQRRSDSTRKHR